jgi:phage shock protein A
VGTLDRMRAAVAGTIAEIEEARRDATRELIAFKAGEKLMAARAGELEQEAGSWQRRAEEAVRAGDDELAREALVRRGWAIAELAQVQEDRREQARVAAELLRGRRELDARLAQLRLREGTVAAGLAAARGDAPLAAEGPAWDRFADAERRIEDEAAEGELAEAEIDEAERAQHQLRELEKGIRADAALAELKRKMR